MKPPKITIGDDYVGIDGDDFRAICDKKEFKYEIGQEEVSCPVDKLGKHTNDPFLNLLTGLGWLIQIRVSGKK